MNTEDRRYCVYFHKKATTLELFYIGSGVEGKREKHFQNRSKAWHKIVEEFGVKVEIYRSGLTLQEARLLENELLEEFSDSIVNSRKHSEREIYLPNFTDYIHYDETSPTFLRWIKETGPRSKLGQPAGNLHFVKGKPRQTMVMVNGYTASISRLIWTMFNGDIPEGLVIDHIDGNHHNNNVLNLRAVSLAENSRNRRFDPDRGLPTGITLQGNRFIAVFTDKGIRFSSQYSISKYGEKEAFSKAVAWRNTAIINANKLGAGYESGHFTDDEIVDFSHTVDSFTGVHGVIAKRVKGEIKAFEALYHKEGKRLYKSFSVSRYGYNQALEMAKESRKNIEAAKV